MLIAWLEPPSLAIQGDQIHRTQVPVRALCRLENVQIVAGCWLAESMQRAALEADLLVCCQAYDLDLLPLIANRQRRGLATIVEVNDHFAAPPEHADARSFYASARTVATIWQMLRQADGVQFSTPYLKRRFGAGLPHTHCSLASAADDWPLPAEDLLPVSRFRRHLAKHKQRLVLGWGGSTGHRADLQAYLPAIASLLARHPDLHFLAMAPRALHSLFAGMPPKQVTLWSARDFGAYRAFVGCLDISLAPLLDTPFNRGRSDVKFLEAATAGAAFVGQRGPAYGDTVRDAETGLLFSSAEEMAAAVLRLRADACLRRQLIAAARNYCSTERAPAAAARAQLQFFVSAVARARANAGALSRPRGHEMKRRGQAPSSPEWIGLAKEASPLFVALSDPSAAGSAVAEATALAPQFYLPQLVAAHLATVPDLALAAASRACSLAPTSLLAALTWLRLCSGREDDRAALARARTVTAEFPACAAAWSARADICLAAAERLPAGDGGFSAGEALRSEAALALTKALRLAPEVYVDVLRLAHLLGQAPGGGDRASWQVCLGAAKRQLAELARDDSMDWQPPRGRLAQLQLLAAQAAARVGDAAAARTYLARARAYAEGNPAPRVSTKSAGAVTLA